MTILRAISDQNRKKSRSSCPIFHKTANPTKKRRCSTIRTKARIQRGKNHYFSLSYGSRVKNYQMLLRTFEAPRDLRVGAHVKGQMNRVLQRANKRSLFSESVVVRKTNTYIPESIPPQTFPTKRLQMMIISGTSPLKSKVLESNDIRAIYYHISKNSIN